MVGVDVFHISLGLPGKLGVLAGGKQRLMLPQETDQPRGPEAAGNTGLFILDQRREDIILVRAAPVIGTVSHLPVMEHAIRQIVDIAVGQELDYRTDMALEMLEGQILPWLILLPVLLAGLFVLLTRELAPLHALASELRSRRPEEASLLDTARLPSEVLPMAESLNGFFARTNAMLTRERSFLSDAAHELRTPLAGLRLQAQVAAQPGVDEQARREALFFLRQGIDRCSRLMEQLLALSRLESSADNAHGPLAETVVNWASLLQEALPAYRTRLEESGLHLESQIVTLSAEVRGNPGLLSMLLRNVLENAAFYTPEGGLVRVTLERESLVVQNDCRPMPEEYAARLGERFFRPPGQDRAGSGLGLSIIMRIAELHGFRLEVRTERDAPGFSHDSFRVSLRWQQP